MGVGRFELSTESGMILETCIRWCGAAIAYLTLGVMFYGIWRGVRQPAGRASGQVTSWLRSARQLALGRMYFVSSSLGTQLYAGHQLVKRWLFAIVRHPMYLGLIVTAVGSLLLYRTWTTVAYAIFASLLVFRARREEQTLADEFGEAWQTYTARTPMILPCRKRKGDAV